MVHSSKPFFQTKLGRSLSTADTWGRYEGKHMIAITLSPDPQRNRYGDMPEEEQIAYCKIALTLALDKYPQVKYEYGGFEYNTSGNIHFHGLLLLRATNNPTAFAFRISKFIHNEVGRKRTPSYIACHTDCKDDYKKWRDYCIKEDCIEHWNGLRPAIMTVRKTILDYL